MLLIESGQIVSGFVPVDLQTGPNDGDWIILDKYRHVAVIFFKAAGTAGDDPTLTLEQATDVAGTGAKALTFTDLYRKQGAALTAIGQWTKTTQAASATFTDATSAEVQALWVVEFNASDLDVDNDFVAIRARVADVGAAAQVGALLYVLSEARYGAKGVSMPSAIA